MLGISISSSGMPVPVDYSGTNTIYVIVSVVLIIGILVILKIFANQLTKIKKIVITIVLSLIVSILLSSFISAALGFPSIIKQFQSTYIRSRSGTETYKPTYKESTETIKISTIGTSLPSTITVIDSVLADTPLWWDVRKESEEMSKTATLGSGIASYITVRKGENDTYVEDRLTKIKQSRDVTKEIVSINDRSFITYNIGGKFVGDTFDSGFRDWIVRVGDNTYVISTVEEISKEIAAVIYSLREAN